MNVHSVVAFAFLVLVASVAKADDQNRELGVGANAGAATAPVGDARLREIIAHVRSAEDQYRNIEMTIFITSQDVANPIDPNDQLSLSKSEQTCYTLQQAELFLFKRREVQTRGPNKPSIAEQVAAFDGETTTSVVFENCANIFAGRHEPSQLYPPHTWALRPLWVNYPLSTYLQGTNAIKKHPKSFKSSHQGGRVFEVAKVEVAYEGEEAVEGIDCVKLTSRHWCRETDSPQVARIWLAPDRDYLCVKMTISFGEGEQSIVYNESRTVDWLKLKPDLWLPKQIETTDYFRPRNGGNPMVRRRDKLSVTQASAERDYSPKRFRDIKIPAGLPTYRIDQDGFVEGSAARAVNAPPGDPAELDRVIAEVKRHEHRYQRYEVESTTAYRALGAAHIFGGSVTSSDETERTVSAPGKLYSESLSKWHSVAGYLPSAGAGTPLTQGITDSFSRMECAWDGEWTRTCNWHVNGGDLPQTPHYVGLRKGGPNGLNAFRPHTAVFSDHRMRCRALSDFLTAKYWDEANKYRYLVQYLEDESFQGLRCAKLRLGFLMGKETEPKHQFFFLWLARERNYLPVRAQHVELMRSDRIPTGDAYADDLREITPGLWFPYHVIELAHDSIGGDGAGSGQVLISWRRERQLERLELEPEAPEELFAPAAAAGTWVYVSDNAGNRIGRFRQRKDGLPAVSPDKFAVMEEVARVDRRDPEDQKRRQAAQDALLGTPLPDFGDGTWLNGARQTAESLAGKVLLIEFWAEWWQPSENDLTNLAAASRGLATDGVTVVSVHPAGSDQRDIQDFADEVRYGGPIYMDRAEPANSRSS